MLSTTQDLELAGGPKRFNKQADKYASGDRDSFAAAIVAFGIEPAQNVQIDIVSITRGGIKGARTTIIEYTLSSSDPAMLDEAVSNVNAKVAEGAEFKARENVKRSWPFLSNDEVSLVLADGERADDDVLNLLEESGADDGNYLWYVVAVTVTLVMLCGGVGFVVHRNRKSANQRLAQVAQVESKAEAEVELEEVEVAATTLVSENV